MERTILTGYPSTDKPWLKYYSEEALHTPVPQCTVYDFLFERNKDRLDDIALVYFGNKISYKQLFKEIDTATGAFISLGVKPGDTVTICSVNMPEVVYAFYALNRLGAISNMIDPRTNVERISQYLVNAKSKVVFSIDKALPKFTKMQQSGIITQLISLSPADSLPFPAKLAYMLKRENNAPKCGSWINWKTFISKATSFDLHPGTYKKGCPATIVYTGGTSGIPKGAVLSNDSLNALTIEYETNGMDYKRGDRFLNIMPPFIAYGVSCGLNMPLCIGLTNILIPLFDPDQFGDLIHKYRPNHFIGVPTHYEKLITSKKAQNLDLSFIKTAAAGGDTLPPSSEDAINDFLKLHGCRNELIKGYGMTELGSAAATTRSNVNKRGSVGIPLPKTVASVHDIETGKELLVNQEGELYFSSPTMMLGYLNNSKEMDKALWMDENGTVWIRSGDIGYLDEDGFIFVQGRMKRMIIRPDGHNVWPSQIEEVVMRHPSVSECAVVGMPNPEHKSGKIPTAFVVLKNGADKTLQLIQEIDRFSKEYLPERDAAMAYCFCDDLPLTPVGKVDYLALEKGVRST